MNNSKQREPDANVYIAHGNMMERNTKSKWVATIYRQIIC